MNLKQTDLDPETVELLITLASQRDALLHACKVARKWFGDGMGLSMAEVTDALDWAIKHCKLEDNEKS